MISYLSYSKKYSFKSEILFKISKLFFFILGVLCKAREAPPANLHSQPLRFGSLCITDWPWDPDLPEWASTNSSFVKVLLPWLAYSSLYLRYCSLVYYPKINRQKKQQQQQLPIQTGSRSLLLSVACFEMHWKYNDDEKTCDVDIAECSCNNSSGPLYNLFAIKGWR